MFFACSSGPLIQNHVWTKIIGTAQGCGAILAQWTEFRVSLARFSLLTSSYIVSPKKQEWDLHWPQILLWIIIIGNRIRNPRRISILLCCHTIFQIIYETQNTHAHVHIHNPQTRYGFSQSVTATWQHTTYVSRAECAAALWASRQAGLMVNELSG